MPIGELTFAWNPNPEADLAGYWLWIGTSPAAMAHWMNVGMTVTPAAPSITVRDFPQYGTVYFALSAYDTSNNESAMGTAQAHAIAPLIFPLLWP